jgi:SPP1 gp7 family putative phage head morphogenesis protein
VADLHSLIVNHSIDLTHYANNVVNDIIDVLNRADKELFAKLTQALQEMNPSEFSMQRLTELLSSVRELNAQAYQEIGYHLEIEMAALSVHESEFQQALLEAVTDEAITAITPEQAFAAGLERPLQGRLMEDWASDLGDQRYQRLQDSVAQGFVQGKTVPEMVSEIRGTRAGNYQDGILQIDSRNAEAVARTSVGHFSQAARMALYSANPDIVQALIWVSTLDNRTTEICMERDGLRYTLDGEPIDHDVEWLGGPGNAHWNCRSTCIVDTGDPFGFRANGTRASMDGPVPASTTYADWLEAQSPERQDEILGPRRAELMRDGKYQLKDFYNNKGRFLTLDELRAADARTFDRLGM